MAVEKGAAMDSAAALRAVRRVDDGCISKILSNAAAPATLQNGFEERYS
jgi:hypothetical protein